MVSATDSEPWVAAAAAAAIADDADAY